jgi:putative DNA primase/helicase
MTPGTFDTDAARTFLTTIFGGTPADHWLLLWSLNKVSYWNRNLEEIMRVAGMSTENKNDLYIGCGTSPRDMGLDHRCKADEIAGIGAVWADIDVKSPVHTKTNLCPDIETAIIWARALRPAPTFIVNSGHGLQLWWAEGKGFWAFKNDEDRDMAARTIRGWQTWLRQEAPDWEIDATQDLSRIMRLPGTWNWKGEPKPVVIVE